MEPMGPPWAEPEFGPNSLGSGASDASSPRSEVAGGGSVPSADLKKVASAAASASSTRDLYKPCPSARCWRWGCWFSGCCVGCRRLPLPGWQCFWMYAAVAVWTVLGLIFLTCGGLSFSAALHTVVSIATTVGPGVQTLQSQFLTMFMVFYILAGIVVVVSVASNLVEFILELVYEPMTEHLLIVCGRFGADWCHKRVAKCWLLSLGVFLVVLTGSLLFGLPNSFAQAVEAQQPTWIDAAYVTTLMTCGLGDFGPGRTNVGGLWVSIAWQCLGSVLTGLWAASIAALFVRRSQWRKFDRKRTRAVFDLIDVDGNGCLTRFEFVTFVLEKHGVITHAKVDEILATFAELDKDGSGSITADELEEVFDPPSAWRAQGEGSLTPAQSRASGTAPPEAAA